MTGTVKTILEELTVLSECIRQDELDEMVRILKEQKEAGARIFLAGAGRSGCIVKAFANRMMHLGFSCHVVGDITVPPIKKGDILFTVSGSGKTASLVKMAEKAAALKAGILTVTLNETGDLANMAEAKILLPGSTRLAADRACSSVQPVGSAFEQLAWLTCDALILLLRDRLGLNNEDLIARHANLE